MGKVFKEIEMTSYEYENLLTTMEDMVETLNSQYKHHTKMTKRIGRLLNNPKRTSASSIALLTLETDMDILKAAHKSMKYHMRRGVLRINKDAYALLKDMVTRYVQSTVDENDSGDIYTLIAEEQDHLDTLNLFED